MVNLLRLLRGDLRGLDLSRLTIRQAYLAEVEAQDAGLAHAHFADTVLADAFAFPGSVALSRDGALLAAGTSSGQVWLWRVADRTPLWAVQGHTSGVWGVAVSADRELVASAGAEGTVQLWETGTGRLVATMQGHAGGVWALALPTDPRSVEDSPGSVEHSAGRGGRVLASGGFDGTARVWEVSSGRPVATVQGDTSGVWRLGLSADGQLLASSDFDGTVRLWSLTGVAEREGLHGMQAEAGRGRPVAALQGHTGTVSGVAVSADGRLVASAGGEGSVRLWEADTGRPVATLQGHTGAVRSVALSADGQLLASGTLDGKVRLWPLTGVAEREGQHGMQAETHAPSETPRGGASTHVPLRIPVPKVQGSTGQAGRPVVTLETHASMVYSVALSADGQLVASGGEDRMVRLWMASTGQPVAVLEGHSSTVYSVALSADGELVASGGGEGQVRLWETGTGRLLATLRGHTAPITAVAISGDGRLLASVSDDATVRVWAAPSGLPLSPLRGHAAGLWAVALSADGRLLASGSLDGTIRLWEMRSGDCLRTLRADRRYERLDITGLTGITDAQREALFALGAIEQHAPGSEPNTSPIREP